MSRAGYYDDGDDHWQLICWRGAVASAIRGKRGQAFLRELRDALDDMPAKRLIADELTIEGDACALGAVARWRGLDVTGIDADDHDSIHWHFGISNALAREIIWANDESWPYPKTPEERWRKMRWWVEAQLIRPEAA
jgi:hypothetical protein